MRELYFGGKNKIYYRKNSFLERETVVFVHGVSGSSSAWLPYEKYFERKFNIISFDLRGHGKSFRPKRFEDYGMSKFSGDLYNLLKKERVKKFVLVSHSFGSLIALDFVKKHQGMLKGLVLVSPNAAPSKRMLSKLLIPAILLSKILNYLPQIKKTGEHVDYENHRGSGDWNVRRTIADAMNTGLRSYVHSINQAYRFNMEGFLPKIKVPTLIIHGRRDSIFPIGYGKDINSAIKGSKFVVFDNSDHIIVLNDFGRLSKEIEKFVRSL